MDLETGMPRKNDPDRERGLYGKFEVRRTDPQAQERHSDCWYFVLDPRHDAFACIALKAYADACAADYPLLAADLRRELPDDEESPA